MRLPLFRYFILTACAIIPMGCGSYFEPLTFSADANSGIAGGYQAFALVRQSSIDNPKFDPSTPEGRARFACAGAFASLDGRSLAVDPLSAIVVSSAVGLAFDLLADSIAARAKELEDRSKRSEILTINVDKFDFQGISDGSTCLVIERLGKPSESSAKESVFTFVAVVKRIGDLALAWKAHAMQMSHARAITGNDQPVKVDVAISTAAIVERQTGPTIINLGESNFQSRMIPSGNVNQHTQAENMMTGSAFPRPHTQPDLQSSVVLTIAVTETGSGSGQFSSAITSAQDNLKALRDFLTNYSKALAER